MKIKALIAAVASCGMLLFASVPAYASGINDMTSPLQGQWTQRVVTHPFGVTWAGTPSQCQNLTWKHAGTDVQASVAETVYAAESGVVRVALSNAQWGGWVTIEHTPPGQSPFTTVYWHVSPSVSQGQWVAEGQAIGSIANLGSNTHFHFGVRVGSYNNTSNRGALPDSAGCPSFPPFPENFINPLSLSYHNK